MLRVENSCETAEATNEVQLQNIAFQNNQIAENKRIIAMTEPSCTHLTLRNVNFVSNHCSRDGCASMASVNELINVSVERNTVNRNGSASHGVFTYPAGSKTTAFNISGFENEMRIFNLVNSTFFMSYSHFQGNGIYTSSWGFDRTVGGSVILSTQSRVRISETSFEENSANDAGAINALISQLSLVNCTFRGNNGLVGSGGAIRATEYSNINLTDTEFVNNTANQGGACYFVHTEVTMKNLTFNRNNATDGSGGAIYTEYGAISGTTLRFYYNEAGRWGGGLCTDFTTYASLTDVVFRNNSGKIGGAIGVFSSSLELLPPCRFVQNRGKADGGAIAESNSDSFLTSCYFVANMAENGGALWMGNGSVAVINSTNYYNRAESNNEDIVELFQMPSFNLSDSLFSYNEALGSGGAISLSDNAVLSASGIMLYRNEAESGGGIRVVNNAVLSLSESTLLQNKASDSGGAVFGRESTIQISHSRFNRNRSNQGGGLFALSMDAVDLNSLLFQNNSAKSLGGAVSIFLSSNNVSVSGCNFSRNDAEIAGAFYSVLSVIIILNSHFVENKASSLGAGLVLSSCNVTMKHSVLLSNEATSFAGMHFYYGVQLFAEGVSLVSNVALENGGGIGIDSQCSLHCLDCEFRNNVAERGAGLYIDADDSLPIVTQLQDSIFEGNNASEYGGGIHFRRPQDVRINCENADVLCSRVVLLNTIFRYNIASQTGSAILTTDPRGVLMSCNYSPQESHFLDQDHLSLLFVVDPHNVCKSWIGNQLTEKAVGDVVGTYGLVWVLSTDPDEEEAKITYSTDDGFVLQNVKSGAQLPVIHVSIYDAYGNGPMPTESSSFKIELYSFERYFPGTVNETITGGVGTISDITSVKPPGNYTLQITPNTVALPVLNLLIRIRQCQVGEESTRGGELCQECDVVSYNFDPKHGNCTTCPNDANCEGRYIIPNEGFWHKSPCHVKVMRCLNDEACQYRGRQQKLANFTQDFVDCSMNTTTQNTYGVVLCHEGYEGPLCGSCQKDHGLSIELKCSKCPHAIWSVLIILFSILYLLVLASFTIRGCLPVTSEDGTPTSSPRSNIVWNSTRSVAINLQMVEMMRDGYVPPEVIDPARRTIPSNPSSSITNELELTKWMSTEILKILINFLQVTAIAATVNVRWTEEIEDMFEAEEYIGALTTMALSQPIDCILGTNSSTTRSIWRTLCTLFVPFVDVLCFVLFWNCRTFFKKKDFAYFLKRSILSIVAVTYISYLGLTKLAVRNFYCINVYDSENHVLNSQTSYWAIDTSIPCYGRDHIGLVVIGVLVLVLVSFLFPLVSAIVITKNKIHTTEHQGWMFETMGFLYRAFKGNLMCWESIVMLRKACLSIIVVFSYPLGGQSQGLLALIVLILSLSAHMNYLPYRKEFHKLNSYEFWSLLVSSFTFLLGQFFNDEKTSEFTKEFVAFLIISMNSIFVLFMVVVLLSSTTANFRMVLASEGIQLQDNARPWTVLKIYLLSRISRYYRAVT
eukprot:g6360.t1